MVCCGEKSEGNEIGKSEGTDDEETSSGIEMGKEIVDGIDG
jgi:hypothetical protein